MMRTQLEPKLPLILVMLVGVSLIAAIAGLDLQLPWIGKPLGSEGATFGDISAGVFLASSVATFIFAARTQDHANTHPGREKARGIHSH
jgi:hypothetical protein